MSRFRAQPKSPSVLVKVSGAVLVVGLHLAVLAAIVSSKPTKPELELPEAVEVRFVEIADEVVDAAPNVEQEEPVEAEIPPPEEIPYPPPEPDIVPEPEPEPEPEPVEAEIPPPEEIPYPPPEPEIAPEPEPEPEAIVEEVKPEPPPPPPKPKPEPKPKPVVKPAPPPPPKAAPSGKAAEVAVPKAPPKPVDPDRPRMVGKVDYLGKRPMPVYPRASERRGEQGRVVIRVVISAQGDVINASVQSSSGYSRLDDAALKAARSARFKPYTENGIAYKAMADIPFDFVL